MTAPFIQSSPEPSGETPLPPGLYGVNPFAVVQLLRQRALHKDGIPFRDGRKLALVLEGGAMRAAAPAGGALALAHLGMTNAFDSVYATSAGAMNASYFLSGQGDFGITIYFDDLTTGRFIDRRRFWKIVDVDYVFDTIITKIKPLDVERVRASRTRLYAAVIDINTGIGSVIDTASTSAPLLSVIKAALSIPVLYNRTVQIGGKSCMDGGLHIPFPLQQAIDDGCTDVLVLLSRGSDYVSCKPTFWLQLIFDIMCSRGRRGVSRTYANHHLYSRAARDIAFGRAANPAPGVNIATICLEKSEPLEQTTVDPVILRSAAISYGRRTLSVLGVDPGSWALGPAHLLKWPMESGKLG